MLIELGALRAALADRPAFQRDSDAGGMEVVCLADDGRHGRQVAFNLLLPTSAAAPGAARSHCEIRMAASPTVLHFSPLPLAAHCRSLEPSFPTDGDVTASAEAVS